MLAMPQEAERREHQVRLPACSLGYEQRRCRHHHFEVFQYVNVYLPWIHQAGAPHSTYVGGSNIKDDRPYDQVAFFPGPIADRLVASAVFDFDGAIFAHLRKTRGQSDFEAYLRYYMSDHRLLWVVLDTT